MTERRERLLRSPTVGRVMRLEDLPWTDLAAVCVIVAENGAPPPCFGITVDELAGEVQRRRMWEHCVWANAS